MCSYCGGNDIFDGICCDCGKRFISDVNVIGCLDFHAVCEDAFYIICGGSMKCHSQVDKMCEFLRKYYR